MKTNHFFLFLAIIISSNGFLYQISLDGPIDFNTTQLPYQKKVVYEEEFTPHAPIFISSNDDFALQTSEEDWKGTGTSNDPYIIEGYHITERITINYTNQYSIGSRETKILIQNTDVHFKIRNSLIERPKFQCTTVNGTETIVHPCDYPGESIHNIRDGITLINTKNAIIENVTIVNIREGSGVHVIDSSNIFIQGNIILDNSKGIKVKQFGKVLMVFFITQQPILI
ncbi:MAG: hypothetical protein HeimC3_14290 [Candidatus Heimdallarchaeota archaeon LC_3]|nr:MAG: hypothetical protein HeimC3_14290 [Candidatus Heimdallarchaeota archaeon LC_3]